MKKQLLTVAMALLGLCSFAQSGGKISGNIKDGGQQAVIDAASVSLLLASDSLLVKTSITDKEGNFSFENVKEGNYLLMASSIGHTQVYSNSFSISASVPVFSAGTLQLLPYSKKLAEVVVSSKKNFVERKIDKTIINPDAMISNTGASAMEVLEKSPGVTVDKEGNISLKGKQGVMVMLDGKPSYMNAADLANYLRGLSSTVVDQIEIMTNPSAKYDAAGNSGIINIKTKKTRQVGFNGNASASYGQGKYQRSNNSLNLNYRKNKVNIFSSLSGNFRKDYQQLEIYRRYMDDSKATEAIFEQNSYEKKKRQNYFGKIGMDYFAGKNTTLGFVFKSGYNKGNNNPTNLNYLKNPAGIVDSIVSAYGSEKSIWKDNGINLNLRQQIDSLGKELTADLDYIHYNSTKDQVFDNRILNADQTLKSKELLIGDLPSDITIYSAKTDYVHPFKNGLKMEAGLKFSNVKTDNYAGYFNVIGEVKTIDYDKTNRFKYNENIGAAYVNFSRNIKKWGIQAGLRLERSNYSGHQFGNPQKTDSSFAKTYTSAFPTVYLSYDANDKNSFGLSYGRRINRPSYEDLNPFMFFIDKYTYGQGNPFLKPMFSNNFEASHTYNKWLTTTLNYSLTTDMQAEYFEREGLATVIRTQNYGKMHNVNLSFNAQLQPAKWWSTMVYAEGRYQNYIGLFNGYNVNLKAANIAVNINNQFTINKKWSAELSGFYLNRESEGQIIIKQLGQINIGVQKKVLKDKATLKFAVSDLLKTMNAKGYIDFKGTYASFSQHRDSRIATLTFSYRFGKPIKGLKTRKSGGAADEQNRVKGAN
ncbi:MAG: TonB-dependent receptor [Ferruginibacter sp.]|nr:TonB-dependent receptor [Chitinophagaceae bacterium]MBP6046941.1 TonB-dependent receptor [Ferruginibacter sp.]